MVKDSGGFISDSDLLRPRRVFANHHRAGGHTKEMRKRWCRSRITTFRSMTSQGEDHWAGGSWCSRKKNGSLRRCRVGELIHAISISISGLAWAVNLGGEMEGGIDTLYGSVSLALAHYCTEQLKIDR